MADDTLAAFASTIRPTLFPPSDTVKWNNKITAPIIIPIVAIVVIITFFICALVKCLKVTWDKKRRSDMYEITDLLPEKSKVIPESVAIDEGDIELPNENEKLHHRHVFMSSTSNNSSPSPVDNGDDLERTHGLRAHDGKRPTGATALKLLKFSNIRSVITKKKMVSTTMSSHVTSSNEEGMVTLDIESGLESGIDLVTESTASTSVKQVNNSNGNIGGHSASYSPGHRSGTGVHDSSNDTNDSNFGDELEDDLEVPGYMNSNLDEVVTPGQPPVSPSSSPMKKAPIALTESEV